MGKSIRKHNHQRRKNKDYYDNSVNESNSNPNPRRRKSKTEIQKGIDQNGDKARIRKRHVFIKKDRLTKQELMKTLEFELEADDYETS